MTFVRLLILHVIALLSFTGKIRCTVGVRCVSRDPDTGSILGSGVCFTWDEQGRAACLGPGPHYNFTGAQYTFCNSCDIDRERCCYDKEEALPSSFSRDSCPAKPTTASPYQMPTAAPPTTSTTTLPTTSTTRSSTTTTTVPTTTTSRPTTTTWTPAPIITTQRTRAPVWNPCPRDFESSWFRDPITTVECARDRWYPFGCNETGKVFLSYCKPQLSTDYYRDRKNWDIWYRVPYTHPRLGSGDLYLPFRPKSYQASGLTFKETTPSTLQGGTNYFANYVRLENGLWGQLLQTGELNPVTLPGIEPDPDQSGRTPAPPATTPWRAPTPPTTQWRPPPTTTYRPAPPPNPCPKPFTSTWYNYPVTLGDCGAGDRWYPFGCRKNDAGLYLSYCTPRLDTNLYRSPDTWPSPWYATQYRHQVYPLGTLYTPFRPKTEQWQSKVLFATSGLVSKDTVPLLFGQWVKLDNGLWGNLLQSGSINPVTAAGIEPDDNQSPPSNFITSSYVQPTNAPYNPYQPQPAVNNWQPQPATPAKSGIWYLNPITTSPCYLQDRWYPWGCTGPNAVAYMNPRRNTQEYRDETYGGMWYRYPEGAATYYTGMPDVLPFKVANLNKPAISVPAHALTPQDRQILLRDGFYTKWVHLINGKWAKISAGDGEILNESQKLVVDGT